jgi:MarR family transcriptional regulator for hemolysin
MNMYEMCLLHARSDRVLRGSIAAHLEESQITMMEWLLLGVIAKGSSKGVNMSDIAEALHVTLPQVTALVNKLLPLKLVRQKSANTDRRSRLVTLTNKGEVVLGEASKILDTARSKLLEELSQEDLDGYTKTLQKIIASGI